MNLFQTVGLQQMHRVIIFSALAFASLVYAQNTSAFGTITAADGNCTAQSCVYYHLPENTLRVIVTISGTWSGTLNISAVNSRSATYQNLNSQSWTNLVSTTANTSYSVAVAGATFLLVQAPKWSSGTANVSMTASQYGPPLANPVYQGQVTTTGNLQATSYTATGRMTGNQVGSVYQADQFPGSNPSVQINNCIQFLLGSPNGTGPGGTCDARAFTGSYNMSQQINVGYSQSTTTPQVTLLLPNTGRWTWGLTDATSCGIRQFNDTAIIGTRIGGTFDGLRLDLTSTANMDSLYCTDPANSVYVRAEGFAAFNDGSGKVANGLIHVNNTFDESNFSYMVAVNWSGDDWHLDGPCCGTSFDHIQGQSDGNVTRGGTPLTINNADSITIADSTFNGPKDGNSNIRINAGGNIIFHNVFMEKYSANFTAPMVYIGAGAWAVKFDGGHTYPSQCPTSSQSCAQVSIEDHSGDIDVSNFEVSITASANALHDVVNNITLPSDGKAIRKYSTECHGCGGSGGSYVQHFLTDGITFLPDSHSTAALTSISGLYPLIQAYGSGRDNTGGDGTNGINEYLLANEAGVGNKQWAWCRTDTSYDAAGTGMRMVFFSANTYLAPPTILLQGWSCPSNASDNAAFVIGSPGQVTWSAGYLGAQLHTPASSSEACNTGEFADDANYHYVCTATNTWKRVALSSF